MFYGAIYLFIELDIFKSRLTFCPDKKPHKVWCFFCGKCAYFVRVCEKIFINWQTQWIRLCPEKIAACMYTVFLLWESTLTS